MRFTLTFDADNAAFETDPDSAAADVLRRTANVVACRGTFDGEGNVRDANGNTVGRWTFTDDSETDDPMAHLRTLGFPAECRIT